METLHYVILFYACVAMFVSTLEFTDAINKHDNYIHIISDTISAGVFWPIWIFINFI